MNLLTHERPARPHAADLYEVLGALRSDDFDTLRLKFRRLSRMYHPDTSFQPAALDKFQRINAAYDVLSNPGKRAMYDEFGQVPIPDEQLAKESNAVLMKLVEQLFGSLEGCDEAQFETVDPLAALRNKVEEEKSTTEILLDKERALCRKLNKVIARLIRKGNADNIIAMISHKRIADSKNIQFAMLTALLVWGEVAKALQSYDYRIPQPPVKRRTHATYNPATFVDLLFT